MSSSADTYSPAGRSGGSRFAFRINHQQLARMCHNVGSSLHAGVDIRRIWQTEASRGSNYYRHKMEDIRDRISEGDTLTDAFRATGRYFPPMLCEMVDVGERTGRLEAVFLRLGEHYDNLVRLRRTFLMGIAWPMFELTLGLGVIGLYIWIIGMIADPPPMTFFGLYGTRGLIIYCSVIGSIVAVIGGMILAVLNGWISIDPLIRLLYHIPILGPGLKSMAMSRLCWSLSLASDSDIDARRFCTLALRTTQNSYFTDHIEGIKYAIRTGSDLHTAFQRTGVFPDEFLDALQTGEISGRISESMAVMANEYEGRAKNACRVISVAAGVMVFLMTAGLLIAMIFQMAMQYIGILNEASQI